jgi:hypothetical protein
MTSLDTVRTAVGWNGVGEGVGTGDAVSSAVAVEVGGVRDGPGRVGALDAATRDEDVGASATAG